MLTIRRRLCLDARVPTDEAKPQARPDAARTGETTPEVSLPLAEERLSIRKPAVETGRVRVRTVVQENEQPVREHLAREDVQIQRVVIKGNSASHRSGCREGRAASEGFEEAWLQIAIRHTVEMTLRGTHTGAPRISWRGATPAA